ncbi:hypothetical protein [Mycolicibacterium sp. 050158]|uniref:hypothetical protein n=1 Tax=Mycolicibacterium sp. 050158 TaxID=3090602 RepID=UPI00299E3B19|nr:hypothetical protein [Mycolicibacterium sp. 050158]MDX1890850.1 hypothetical protein [Mycolicibacterium sp. 050158]
MPWFRDAEGVRWSVRRTWWPFGEVLWDSNDSGVLFWIGFLITAGMLIAWPIWLSGKVLTLSPWTIKVRRKGKTVRSEKVKGWAESRRRMAEIVDELRAPAPPDGEPESHAVVY